MLCEKSIINEETGNISIIEAIQEITVPRPPKSDETPETPETPLILFDFSLIISWEKQELLQSQDEPKFRLRILSPSQKILLEGERSIDFTEKFKAFTVLSFNTFPVPEPGFYKFHIQLPSGDKTQWEDVWIVKFQVIYEQPEQLSSESKVIST